MDEELQRNLNDKKPRKLPKKMPWVLPGSCEGCGDCVNHCPRECLKMMETNAKGVFVPWILDPFLCSGCGKCADCCIMGGIVTTEYVEQAIERFLKKRPEIYSQ